MNREVMVAPDPAALAREGARRFAAAAASAMAAREFFVVALSGGSTPRALYQTLAQDPFRSEIDWARVQVFFSDERFVPPDSPESNYHLAQETVLSRVPIPERFVHRVATVDISPEESAALYEEAIRRVFQVSLAEVPRFDLILLGLGPDGHTASLFPDTQALAVADRLVSANFVPKLDAWRITFTYLLINAARDVTFLVEGAKKADVVARVLEGDQSLPAARVRPADGRLIWLLDQAAAASIPVSERTEVAQAPHQT